MSLDYRDSGHRPREDQCHWITGIVDRGRSMSLDRDSGHRPRGRSMSLDYRNSGHRP